MERQVVLTNHMRKKNTLVRHDEWHTVQYLLQQHRMRVILKHIDGTQRLFQRYRTLVATNAPNRPVFRPAYTTPIMERMGRSHTLIRQTLGAFKMLHKFSASMNEIVLETPPEIQAYLTAFVKTDPSTLPIISDSAPSPLDHHGDASVTPQAGDLSVDLTPILKHMKNTRKVLQTYLKSASEYPVTPVITNADSSPIYGVPYPPTAHNQPPNLKARVHGMVLRRAAMKHIDTAYLQVMEIEGKYIQRTVTDDRYSRELQDVHARFVADHVQEYETCSLHSTFPPTVIRTGAEVCSIYGGCEVPSTHPSTLVVEDPVCSLDQKPLVDRVKTALRDGKHKWNNSGGPEAAKFFLDVANFVTESVVGVSKVGGSGLAKVGTALVKATKFAWNSGSEFIGDRAPLTAQYVHHRAMAILSSLDEPKTAAQQESIFLIAGIVSHDCAAAAELEAWAGLHDKILNTLTNMTDIVSSRAMLYLREQWNRDTRVPGSGGEVKMKAIVGLLHGVLTESGAYEIMGANAVPVITFPGPHRLQGRLAWLDDRILSMYPNDARSVKLLVHLSKLPNEIVVEKLSRDQRVLRELEATYSDRFSINHAMLRLQRLDPLALKTELELIKRYARDPEPVRAQLLSLLPDHMQRFKKELGELLMGMTLEQMMHSTFPHIGNDTRHNIVGMKGPWLDTEHTNKTGQEQFVDTLIRHQSEAVDILKLQQKRVEEVAQNLSNVYQVPVRDIEALKQRQTQLTETLGQHQMQVAKITESIRATCETQETCGPESQMRIVSALEQHMTQIQKVHEGVDTAHQILSTCGHGEDKMRVVNTLDRYQKQLTSVIADSEGVCPAGVCPAPQITMEIDGHEGHTEPVTLQSVMWAVSGVFGVGMLFTYATIQLSQGDVSPVMELIPDAIQLPIVGDFWEGPTVGGLLEGLYGLKLAP